MMPFTTYESRVQNGMTVLDEHMPAWYRHISTEDLDILSPSNCICGQLSQADKRGGKNWNRTLEVLHISRDRAAEFGFSVSTEWAESYSELTRAWVEAIKARRREDEAGSTSTFLAAPVESMKETREALACV